ncbi:hypothetical protein CR513_58450, partial [Mucuna pruriens]
MRPSLIASACHRPPSLSAADCCCSPPQAHCSVRWLISYLFQLPKIWWETNHDMVSHIAKARAATEELKETTKRIDKLLMVLILRSLHPNYEHVRDQILSSEQIPSMNSLVTRLLRVPTITKADGIVVENSAMVASRGRGRSGRGTRGILRNGKGGHDKTANISSSDTPSNGMTGSQLILDEEYQEFLRLKSNNHTQSSASPIANGSKMDRNTGQLIGKGHESRGLYYLSNNPSTLCFASIFGDQIE